jgi:hypothetical protein
VAKLADAPDLEIEEAVFHGVSRLSKFDPVSSGEQHLRRVAAAILLCPSKMAEV